MKKNYGLGSGLAELLGAADMTSSLVADRYIEIDIATLNSMNPRQPRTEFNDDSLSQLADSIKSHGIIQPILVRKINNRWQIIAGERRYRAAKIAGLTVVPAIELDVVDESKLLSLALLENIQRQDLGPLEEARAYKQLVDRFGYTHATLSTAIGKSRPYISNMLRILNLPDEVLQKIKDGLLSVGHAKALLASKNPSNMADLAIEDKMSVHYLEDLIREQNATEEADFGIIYLDDSIKNDGKQAKQMHNASNIKDIRHAKECSVPTFGCDLKFVNIPIAKNVLSDLSKVASELKIDAEINIGNNALVTITCKDLNAWFRIMELLQKLVNKFNQ